jgi:hypothetical protein
MAYFVDGNFFTIMFYCLFTKPNMNVMCIPMIHCSMSQNTIKLLIKLTALHVIQMYL